MNEFFLLTFVFVLAACLPLWAGAHRRAEYGPRPRILAWSMWLMAAAGALSFASLAFPGQASPASFPLAFLAQAAYPFAFFVLEYSIHVQRIRKNLLSKAFKRKIAGVAAAGAACLVVCAIAWAAYLPVKDPADLAGGGFVILKLALAASISAIFLCSRYSFALQSGVIRRSSYSFICGFVAALVSLLCSLFFPASPSLPLLPLALLNLVFGVRVFHEYFVYRIGHVNDIHAQQISSEQSRTELLNKVLFSTPEEDIRLIAGTLSSGFADLQGCFEKPELVFRSMMAFRRAGDLLVVDQEDFILEYCVPLADIEHIKQMKAEVIHGHIMAQAFDLSRIASASEGELGFAEAAIRRMLDSGAPVRLEAMPSSLSRLFKLVLLVPIRNQDQLSGMLVLFKTDMDYVFPQEETIIQSLARSLSLILTIIDGKRVQDEKNRLNREMDIAKNIQTSILPTAIRMEGYEVDAQMVTASEVGGDLYDFAHASGRNYLDIADVAGHGLPAGIAALIHMAAFHGALTTAEALRAELDPPELYDIVNKVMVEINRDRIGSDKFMTCNVLSQRGGDIDYAGSHLVGLVHRADSGEVEEIEGMQGRAAFLGLSETAISEQSRGRISMGPGDTLLLYTDGLIEARDMYGRFFGLDGLKAALKAVAGKSLGDAKRIILETLGAFAETGDRKKHGGSYADDVSLVLVRRGRG